MRASTTLALKNATREVAGPLGATHQDDFTEDRVLQSAARSFERLTSGRPAIVDALAQFFADNPEFEDNLDEDFKAVAEGRLILVDPFTLDHLVADAA